MEMRIYLIRLQQNCNEYNLRQYLTASSRQTDNMNNTEAKHFKKTIASQALSAFKTAAPHLLTFAEDYIKQHHH
jgi:hypothetical protein